MTQSSSTEASPAISAPSATQAGFAAGAARSDDAPFDHGPDAEPSWMDRLRGRFGERAGGIALTLLIEGLLVLALLTFGPRIVEPNRKVADMTTVLDIAAPPAPEPESPAPETASDEPRPETDAAPPPSEPAPPEPAPPAKAATPAPVKPPEVQVTKTPALIPLSPNQMAAADLNSMPAKAKPSASSAAPKPMMGPVGGPRRGDTERVGTAKNGQPLYAAAWYREPTDAELKGYLSTVGEPGWATIECRTVADYRVEDCTGLDQSPARSNITQAVLAAAWQFRVRPPRVGGQSLVGTWVRIRITYR